MANEQTTGITFTCAKGGASIPVVPWTATFDMTGSHMDSPTQTIGTTNEALDFAADVTGDVNLSVKNLDPTNYVEIFKDSGNSHLMSKLKPGQSCLLMNVPAASLYARANTAPLLIQFKIAQA